MAAGAGDGFWVILSISILRLKICFAVCYTSATLGCLFAKAKCSNPSAQVEKQRNCQVQDWNLQTPASVLS